MGIDGSYVDVDQLLIPTHVSGRDVSERFELPEPSTLAWPWRSPSIRPRASEPFVDNLMALDARLVFCGSPDRGAIHINERPYGYWKELFERRGYRTFDFIARPHALQFSGWSPGSA